MGEEFRGGIRVVGDFALFTDPNTKADPVSYPVPTQSALLGLLSTLFWKPQIIYEVDAVGVEKPIQYFPFSVNGYKDKAKKDQRQFLGKMSKRVTIHRSVLLDVSYLVSFRLRLNPDAIDEDRREECDLKKYYGMLKEAVNRGFGLNRGQPYLGISDFYARVEWVPYKTLLESKWDDQEFDLPEMFYNWDYAGEGSPKYFKPFMENGWVRYPQEAVYV